MGLLEWFNRNRDWYASREGKEKRPKSCKTVEKRKKADKLVRSFFDSFDALVEPRVLYEYTNALAMAKDRRKSNKFKRSDMPWFKKSRIYHEWEYLDEKLQEESALLRRDPNHVTPFKSALEDYCDTHGITYTVGRMRIQVYARPKLLSQTGICLCVRQYNFHLIGRQILIDRQAVEWVFRDKPNDPARTKLMDAIKSVEKVFFHSLAWAPFQEGRLCTFRLKQSAVDRHEMEYAF